ncbi:MAG TPA: hypothetical protein VFT22_07515 [Kofleriaceae bacterium]|nr:hypothetical protein [Kofleriaceae bacterium]
MSYTTPNPRTFLTYEMVEAMDTSELIMQLTSDSHRLRSWKERRGYSLRPYEDYDADIDRAIVGLVEAEIDERIPRRGP